MDQITEKPLQIATLAIIYRNTKDEMVWLHRGEGEFMQGFHVPPGGKFEQGERGEECIRREIKEETGLDLEKLVWRGIVLFDNKDRDFGDGRTKPDHMVWVYTAEALPANAQRGTADWKWVHRRDFSQLNVQQGDYVLLDWAENKEGIFSGVIKYKGKILSYSKATFYRTDGSSYTLESSKA